ncbi:MAG TPA: flavodoxin domain-containing protein [Casimicrobiaceae bacterium]
MKALAVLYATREGQTRRIAEHVAARLRMREFVVDVLHVGRGLSPDFDLARHAGAVVAVSVHFGKHEKAMVEFVKTHRTELERIPSAFLSVSLSEAGAEDANATAERRKRASANVNVVIGKFLRETAWSPTHVHPVAGALLYRQYGAIVRLVMRFIAKLTRATTDTSRDHEYTDWQALDRFADELASDVERPASLAARALTTNERVPR